MALQMILGRAGSGKSTYLYERILKEAEANPGQNYFMLVPEQFTLSTQQEFVKRSKNHCIMNIDVLSFERLAYRVFDELGMKDITVLDDIGKTLLIRRLVKAHEKELTVLKRNMDKPGYLDQVKSLLTEFSQYHVEEENLTKALGELSESLLYYKLKDLTLLYTEFQRLLKDRYQTQETLLCLLHDVVKDSKRLKDAVICFDGYTGFTPVQQVLLSALLPMVKTMYVTVLLDPEEEYTRTGPAHELFYLSKKYVQSLMRLCKETNTELCPPVVMEKPEDRRFALRPGLAALEKNLFRRKIMPFGEEQQDIRIVKLLNPKEEAAYVAAKLYHYRKAGLRYQEMAVVTADLETYEEVLSKEFDKAGIPYFMDRKKKVTLNAFVEVILGIFEIISGDFSYEGVFRYLKTGFSNLSRQEVEIFENYYLAARMRGYSRIKVPFTYRPEGVTEEDIVRLNEIREKFFAPLMPFLEVKTEGHSVEERTRALFSCFENLDLQDKLIAFGKELMESGEKQKAKEYGAIYENVVKMFERYVSLMGEECIAFDEFEKLVSAGLEATKVATIPAGRDCVIVGDIERTRLNHCRVLLFVGVSEGVIPRISSGSMCLNQSEREKLAELQLELAAGPKERLFVQQFYLYMMMAKAEEQLILTFPASTLSGEAKNPAYLIGRIQEIFPGLTITGGEELEFGEAFFTKKKAYDYLLLHPEETVSQELVANLSTQEEYKHRFEQLAQASVMEREEEKLQEELIKRLYSGEIFGSVSRLETFAGCPKQHFLSYGLKLKERNTGKVTMIDVGVIFHGALRRYTAALKELHLEPDTIEDIKREALSKQAVLDEVAELNQNYFYENARNQYQIKRLIRIVCRTTWAMGIQKKRGGFTPAAFETGFLLDEREEGKLCILDGMKMKLSGKIDRVDEKETEEGRKFRVVDYKSGNTKLDVNEIYCGSQLQLLTYAYARKKMLLKQGVANPECEGAYYYHMKDPFVEEEQGDDDAAIEEKIIEELKLSGINEGTVDGSVTKKSGDYGKEAFDLLEEYTLFKIHELGNAIANGELGASPLERGGSLTCEYCPYLGSCGFEEALDKEKVRKVVADKPEETLEKIKEQLRDEIHETTTTSH